MQHVRCVLLWATLIPCAFGFRSSELAERGLERMNEGNWVVRCTGQGQCQLEDAMQAAIPTNFEYCSNLEAMPGDPGTKSIMESFETVSPFGSFAGFVDYGPTDSFLRFLDEFVMGALPFNDLHSILMAIMGGDVVLEQQGSFADTEITEESSL